MKGKNSLVGLMVILFYGLISCQTPLVDKVTPALIVPVQPQATVQSLPATVQIDYQTVIGQSPGEYGTNGWWTDQDAELWQTRYAELAPAVVRVPALQGVFEPQNDDTDPDHINPQGFMFDYPLPWQGKTVTFRHWLGTLRDADLILMIHVPYLAGWLSANGNKELFSTYPPLDEAEYREYLRALLTFVVYEVQYPPERVILEPINEPDLGCNQDVNVSCFWENWQMGDLVKVIRAAHEVAMEVNPAIRVVGVSECCGTQLVDSLINDYEGQDWLDGISYHRYVWENDFSDGLARGQRLLDYGKPVYLNEYGNTRYWSNEVQGALWHAATLPQIWQAGINPIQFSMAEFPGLHKGYDELGLFKGWGNGWALKPAYWVYANFYKYFGGGELVKIQGVSSSSMLLMASRRGAETEDPMLAIWLTNMASRPQEMVRFEIKGFPGSKAQVEVYDNLQGGQPVAEINPTGASLSFDFYPSANSSYTIIVQPEQP